MTRTKLIVRLVGRGEARAEGIVAILTLGAVGAFAAWVLSRWDDAVLALVGPCLAAAVGLIRSALGQL